jgi:hypothetical protein
VGSTSTPKFDSPRPRGKLFEFAFCGTSDFFYRKLADLATLAEQEPWTSGDPDTKEYDRLYNYVTNTFSRCYELDYIEYSPNRDYAVFNTGLLTRNGEELFGYFEKNHTPSTLIHNESPQPWKFIEYLKSSDRKITNHFEKAPKLATYGSHQDLVFDVSQEIIPNLDHIIDDNWDERDSDGDNKISRFPDHIRNLGKEVVTMLIKQAFETSKVKIRRNCRLVVPQYYSGEIMYLIPIDIPIQDGSYHRMALALEKTSTGKYRVNTLFPISWAYKKARLIMKPESSWLLH